MDGNLSRSLIRIMSWLVPALLLGTLATAQESPALSVKTASAVHDKAAMFSAEAVKKAVERLQKLEQTYHVPTIVETIDSLQGEPIRTVTIREARRAGVEGIFILLSKNEAKLDVEFAGRCRELFGKNAGQSIISAFIEEFRKRSFDEGLLNGVEEVEALLAKAKEAGKTFPAAPAPQEGLVLRNQVRLTLSGARKIVAGAEAKAAELGLKMNIAVVDDGGHLIAFERMDGARPASGYTATTKAVTAATFRAPTGPIPAGTAAPDPLLNLSLQNAATASGGKITTLLGGVPVVVEGQVIAGVGVGGGSGEQDAQVARAGIEAFLAALNGKP